MKRFTILLALIVSAVFIYAQDCVMFYPLEKGTVLTYENYNAKGKLLSTTKQSVIDVKKTGASVVIDLLAESYDKKGRESYSYPFTVECKDGVFYLDMKGYLNQESLSAFQDMEVKMEGSALEMPSNLKPGQTLKDGEIRVSVSTSGMTIMSMDVKVENRKVDAVEDVTVPAGTFNSYKLSQDVSMSSIVNVNTSSSEWYSEEIGMVKSVSYDSKGEINSTTVLVSVER